MLFLIGTFGLNFPIFISTMAVGVFHADARGYGLLSSIMAIGTVAGALLGAEPRKAAVRLLLVGAAVFGLGCALAALAPNYWLFAARARRHRRGRPDVHHHDEQPDAALDRARHARTGDGAARRRRARRHADRGADRRLGGGRFRAALGARRRRGFGLCGRRGGHLRFGASDRPAASASTNRWLRRRRGRLIAPGAAARLTTARPPESPIPAAGALRGRVRLRCGRR